jgi:hypothetical protein
MLKNKGSNKASTSLDGPLFLLCHPANARPTVLLNTRQVLHAVQISWYIFSLLLGSLLANWVGLVDIVDALDFKVMGAFVGHGKAENSSDSKQQFHEIWFNKLLL